MSRCSTQIRFWLPLLLSCFIVLCNSQNSGNTNGAFSDPGVIIGIIVGVVGVLVVLGVSILLCRLFCCKESSCCSCCCKESETYLEAGTVPIKVPSQDGGNNADNKPISTISQDRPTTTTHSRQPKPRRTLDSSSLNPPQYDDIQQQFDWKGNELTNSQEPVVERLSEHSPTLGSDEKIPDDLPAGSDSLPAGSDSLPAGSDTETKKVKPTAKTRRKLIYEADVPDVLKHGGGEFTPLEHEPKKRNPDTARHGREFPERRKRHFKPQPSPHDDNRTTNLARNINETRSGESREFPLLEYEPRTFNTNLSYDSDNMPRTWGKTYQGAVGHMEVPSVEYEPQNQHPYLSSYADDRSRVRAKERRPRELRDIPAARFPSPQGGGDGRGGYSSNPMPPHMATGGRVNLAYNQESTETVV